MTSLTDQSPQNPVSSEGSAIHYAVAPLDSSIYRETVFCPVCECEEEFRTMLEFVSGRIGVCLGCGDERVVGFTRRTE